MSQMSTLPPWPPSAPADDDPFRYGWRFVPAPRPDGDADLERVPLTLDDVLHPQEGDIIPENTQQERDRRHIHNVYEERFADDDKTLSLSDCIIDWDHPTIRPHSPDLTLLEDVLTKDKVWGIYRLAVDGGRPLLVAEIVSPNTRKNDVEIKRDEYWQLGIPNYVIVDQKREGGPRELIVLRHGPHGYVPQKPSADGRYLLPGQIELALEDDRLVCYDAATGEELGDYTHVCAQLREEVAARAEEAKAREAAEDRADEAEEAARAAAAARQQAEEQARLAEEQKRQAQEQARAEAVARKRADEQARQAARTAQRAKEQADAAQVKVRAETEARQRAEEQARAETEARQRAEVQARTEAEARQALEARLREMEDLLRRQKGG